MTAAECSSGIRVYTKTKDGDVREGCNDTTYSDLAQARRYNNTRKKCFVSLKNWFDDNLYQVSLITATAGTRVRPLYSYCVRM